MFTLLTSSVYFYETKQLQERLQVFASYIKGQQLEVLQVHKQACWLVKSILASILLYYIFLIINHARVSFIKFTMLSRLLYLESHRRLLFIIMQQEKKLRFITQYLIQGKMIIAKRLGLQIDPKFSLCMDMQQQTTTKWAQYMNNSTCKLDVFQYQKGFQTSSRIKGDVLRACICYLDREKPVIVWKERAEST